MVNEPKGKPLEKGKEKGKAPLEKGKEKGKAPLEKGGEKGETPLGKGDGKKGQTPTHQHHSQRKIGPGMSRKKKSGKAGSGRANLGKGMTKGGTTHTGGDKKLQAMGGLQMPGVMKKTAPAERGAGPGLRATLAIGEEAGLAATLAIGEEVAAGQEVTVKSHTLEIGTEAAAWTVMSPGTLEIETEATEPEVLHP